MARRVTDRTRNDRTLKQVLKAVQDYLANGGSWVKVLIGLGAIVVALWGFFGFDDRLDAAENRLASSAVKVEMIDEAVDQVETDVGNLQDGISRAVRQLEKVELLLTDLQEIRDELVEAIKDAGGGKSRGG